jgi:hypothetical protein
MHLKSLVFSLKILRPKSKMNPLFLGATPRYRYMVFAI